jgi:pentalenolactone synthase
MTTEADLPQLPFHRPDVLDPAPTYARLRPTRPVVRVRSRAGDNAWLAIGYAEAKALFADDRLGRSHPDPERAPKISTSLMFGGPQGDYATTTGGCAGCWCPRSRPAGWRSWPATSRVCWTTCSTR